MTIDCQRLCPFGEHIIMKKRALYGPVPIGSAARQNGEVLAEVEKENKKTPRGRRVLNVILLLLNIACFLWIFLSWREEQSSGTILDYYRDRGVDVSDFEHMENDGALRP